MGSPFRSPYQASRNPDPLNRWEEWQDLLPAGAHLPERLPLLRGEERLDTVRRFDCDRLLLEGERDGLGNAGHTVELGPVFS
jgi:hypothetical protein